MERTRRFLLVVLLIVLLARLWSQVDHWRSALLFPIELHLLEPKIINLTWRVQQGLSLYPDWETHPHVANFFAPGYFWLTGWIARGAGANCDDLYTIGRWTTTAFALLTGLTCMLLVAPEDRWLGRMLAFLVCMGTYLHVPFGPLSRPDAMADALGLFGFWAALHNRRGLRWLGLGSLLSAIMTKQTAGLYLLAVGLTEWRRGQPRRAVGTLIVVAVSTVALLWLLRRTIEPNIIADFFGERSTPADAANWMQLLRSLLLHQPEMLLLTIMTFALDQRHRWLALAVLAVCLMTALKTGADLNYFLPLRGPAAVGAAMLARRMSPDMSAWSSWRRLGLMTLVVHSLLPSLLLVTASSQQRKAIARQLQTHTMQQLFRDERWLRQKLARPDARALTNSGRLAVHQGDRAAFVDPWLFRLMVNTGRIQPNVLEQRLHEGWYESLIMTRDLFAPHAANDLFLLPAVLIEAAREKYQFEQEFGGFHIYMRKPDSVK